MDEAAKALLGQGVLGVLCVLLLLGLRDIFNRLMDSENKRITEAVDNRMAIERNTVAMIALTEVIKERR